jgi:hypothetical protein
MKTCSSENCSQVNPQPYSAFYKTDANIDGHTGRCMVCIKLQRNGKYKRNKSKFKKRSADWKSKNVDKVQEGNLRDKHGVSYQWYQETLNTQKECCAICKKHKSLNVKDARNNKVRNLAVDHNHTTNQIRGLLCYGCNLALGMLKDNIESAQNLVEYLRFYEEKDKI